MEEDDPNPPPSPPPLVAGRDYTVDPDGRYVFTAAYLLARGTCCDSGCRHCPYGFREPPTRTATARPTARPHRTRRKLRP